MGDWLPGGFEVASEFVPMDREQDHSLAFQGCSPRGQDEEVNKPGKMKSAIEFEGPIAPSELGSWACSSISDTAGIVEEVGAVEEFSLHTDSSECLWSPNRHPDSPIEVGCQKTVQGWPAQHSGHEQAGTDASNQKQLALLGQPAPAMLQEPEWLNDSRLHAARLKIAKLEEDVASAVDDKHIMEVRVAQAEKAIGQLQSQLRVRGADVKAASELVQAHAREMAQRAVAQEASQRRIQTLEANNIGLQLKLSKAEDAVLKLRTKLRQLAEVTRHQNAPLNAAPMHAGPMSQHPSGILTDDIGQPIGYGPPVAPSHARPSDVACGRIPLADRETKGPHTAAKLLPRPYALDFSQSYDSKAGSAPIKQEPDGMSTVGTGLRRSTMHLNAAEPSLAQLNLPPAGGEQRLDAGAMVASLQARPYATDASLQAHMAQWQKLEARLAELSAENDALAAEAAKRGATTGRTLAEKRRSAFVEARLDALSKEMGSLRQQLKRRGLR